MSELIKNAIIHKAIVRIDDTRGMIVIEDFTSVSRGHILALFFLSNNEDFNGTRCPNMYGYRCSWLINVDITEPTRARGVNIKVLDITIDLYTVCDIIKRHNTINHG